MDDVYAVPGTTEYRTPALDASLRVPPLTNCGVAGPSAPPTGWPCP